MGRTRQYGSDAERQRAFRRRLSEQTVRVDRHALDGLHARLDRLNTALHQAAAAGDPTARACCAVSTETLLEQLIRYFEALSPRAGGQETGDGGG